MTKRLQVLLSDETLTLLETIMSQANENNRLGHITYSDAINEMILTSKVDVKALQLKHADYRKTLRSMAAEEELDLDAIIKTLSELRNKSGKRQTKAAIQTNEAS